MLGCRVWGLRLRVWTTTKASQIRHFCTWLLCKCRLRQIADDDVDNETSDDAKEEDEDEEEAEEGKMHKNE